MSRNVLQWCACDSDQNPGKLVCLGCEGLYSLSGFYQHLPTCERAKNRLPVYLRNSKYPAAAASTTPPFSDSDGYDSSQPPSGSSRDQSDPAQPPAYGLAGDIWKLLAEVLLI